MWMSLQCVSTVMSTFLLVRFPSHAPNAPIHKIPEAKITLSLDPELILKECLPRDCDTKKVRKGVYFGIVCSI